MLWGSWCNLIAQAHCCELEPSHQLDLGGWFAPSSYFTTTPGPGHSELEHRPVSFQHLDWGLLQFRGLEVEDGAGEVSLWVAVRENHFLAAQLMGTQGRQVDLNEYGSYRLGYNCVRL